ncbi:MAG: hypothetical protein JXD19_01105 [Deltaproteobacteria bacterium]|nr:hypothetical protein [Deltaproteobacteria bacterium]
MLRNGALEIPTLARRIVAAVSANPERLEINQARLLFAHGRSKTSFCSSRRNDHRRNQGVYGSVGGIERD